MPADFSGSWERDYSRGDDVNQVLRDIYYYLSRTSADRAYTTRPGPVQPSSKDMASIRALARRGYNVFVEIGPHALLRNYLNDCLRAEGVEGRVFRTLMRSDDPQALVALGKAYLAQNDLDSALESLEQCIEFVNALGAVEVVEGVIEPLALLGETRHHEAREHRRRDHRPLPGNRPLGHWRPLGGRHHGRSLHKYPYKDH